MKSKNKTVADIGEFGLIHRIQKILPKIEHKDILIGIGDDTAVIRINDSRALLVTCDIQVEDQHFRLKNISLYQLGRRAMAVNLSDIAAMGGKPTFALVSLGCPKVFALSNFEDLIKGMRDQLSEFSAFIIGGNLSNTENKLIIDITLLGEVSTNHYLTRNGAKIGDRIFVTGNLGASGAGFFVLEKYGKNAKQFNDLVQKHLQPIPRIKIGQRIAQSGFATTMIDVSDGIASDLYHICTMSGVGAEIYQSKLPLPDGINKIVSLSGKSSLHLALHTGEDYELLFTIKPDTPKSIIDSIAQETGILVTEIGRILPKDAGYCLIELQGKRVPIQPKGWDHFGQ
ncbi:MAG: thiamine-phosphate kinase [bacterium]|nr:MAG: thiamine-phosphate kinase [bacterium]